MTFVSMVEPVTTVVRCCAPAAWVSLTASGWCSTSLDVDLPAGELTVIVGPNGCGKSTLLRALARMVPARSGVVELDGKPIGHYPTR